MKHRVALCIGISGYREAELALDNPINDAKRLHMALQARGFDSTLLLEPTASEFAVALAVLRETIEACVEERVFGVVYYAGHAIEIGGFGVLLPSDTPYPVLPSRVVYSGIPVLEIIEALKAARGPTVVVIDACRDAVDGWDDAQMGEFSAWAKSESERLKEAAETEEIAIAYSTSAGQRAYDGSGSNSVYCEKLEEALLRHDVSIVDSLAQCGQRVIIETRAKQRPWIYTNLNLTAGFSDLPTYALVSSKKLPVEVGANTRLHVCGADGAVAINLVGRLQLLHEGEIRGYIDHSASYTAAAVWENEVLLAGPECFVALNSDGRQMGNPLSETARLKIKCSDAFGIALSPNGAFAIVYGLDGYSVLARNGATWYSLGDSERLSDVYSAVFRTNDMAYLSGPSDRVLRLELGHGELREGSIELGRGLNVYDLACIRDSSTIVATCNDGIVVWIDADNHVTNRQVMFKWPSVDVPGAYGRLRQMDLSPDEANLFLTDARAFEKELGPTIWRRTLERREPPGYDLLCCDLIVTSRLLAIGADAGLIFLVDMRSREHVATLDVGSNIGVPLQWMTSDANGAIHAIGKDGIVRYFEPVPPPF